MDMAVIDYLAKWAHYVFGVVWIGLLYYFNLVQTEYFKEADPAARTDAFVKLVPRALWWFRWAAVFTFLTGFFMLSRLHLGLTAELLLGSLLGTIMFLNVWLIIWPNQRILIASNEQLKAGGQALPAAAAAAPKAALASRTNTLFSLPMLFLMGSTAHLPGAAALSAKMTPFLIAVVIVLALEANAIWGKQGVLTTIRGVIVAGLVLTAVLVGVLRFI